MGQFTCTTVIGRDKARAIVYSRCFFGQQVGIAALQEQDMPARDSNPACSSKAQSSIWAGARWAGENGRRNMYPCLIAAGAQKKIASLVPA
jgi:hypothetical protein